MMPFDFQRERELGDMIGLMATEAGRRFVHRILERAGVYRQTFAVDPYITAFNEGQRSQGLALLADLMASCPDQYLAMTREAKRLAEHDAVIIARQTKEQELESNAA